MAANPADGGAARTFSKDDQALRDQQLEFYAGDVKKLDAVLEAFLKKSNASAPS